MKKYYILLFSGLFFGFLQAQNYVLFPTEQDSVAWREREEEWNSGELFYGEDYFYYLGGDTAIASNNYSIIYKSRKPYDLNGAFKVKGFLREVNKKIFFLENINSTEVLLYDFNLSVGDSMQFVNGINFGLTQKTILLSIDSVEMENGTFRKQFNFENESKIIEGIGNVNGVSGLLDPYSGAYLDYNNTLYCVIKSNELIYKVNLNEDIDCFTINVGLKNFNEINIQIFPNPISQFLNFSEKLHKVPLHIYSLSGQIVFEERAFSGTQIDVSFLEKGVYFLKLKGKTSGFTRLIVQ